MRPEFLTQQRLPHDTVRLLAGAFDQPLARGHVLERTPVVESLGLEHVQPVAHARAERQRIESQERQRIAERVEPSAVEDGHRRGAPREALAKAETIEPTEIALIRATDEVVELLGGRSTEVEGSGHAAGRGRRLDDGYVVPFLEEIERGRKAHDAGADDDNLQGKRLICFKARRLGRMRLAVKWSREASS